MKRIVPVWLKYCNDIEEEPAIKWLCAVFSVCESWEMKKACVQWIPIQWLIKQWSYSANLKEKTV